MGLFAPITGGRVSEIVSQETALCKSKTLPTSEADDKVAKFTEEFKDFIDVKGAHTTFMSHWEIDKTTPRPKDKPHSMLLRSLWKSFKADFFKAMFAKLVWSVLVMGSIYFFVFEILDFIKSRDEGLEVSYGPNYQYYICAGFFVSMYVLSLGIQQMGIYSSILGSKVKAALTTEIFGKMIARDPYGSHADIVALVAKDVEKLAESCSSLQYLWSGIFETILAFVITLTLLGIVILPGLGVMLVFMPLQYYMGKYRVAS